jgi:hypothetical protein
MTGHRVICFGQKRNEFGSWKHFLDEVRLQYSRCISEVLPGPNKHLRWGVPGGTRSPDGELIHDDHILADALTAVLDNNEWSVQYHYNSILIDGDDPLDRILSHEHSSNVFYVNRV